MAENPPQGPAPDEGPALQGVRHVVAVASGKGGVGKSTTAVNLAVALSSTGWKVGILDADVYGPSMQAMTGIQEGPRVDSNRRLHPPSAFGIRVMSMAFLAPPDRPVIWRGPMVHGVLQQFIREVDWGELDALVIDLPPGTGDAQLSLCQIVDIGGAVIVTTPQDVSLIDARKGLEMFRQLKVPVLGIIENMSYFECPHCHEKTEIFRHGGGRRTAEELGVPFLGEVPIDPEVVLGGDQGRPVADARPESPAGAAYAALASQVRDLLGRAAAERAPDQTPIMPDKLEWE